MKLQKKQSIFILCSVLIGLFVATFVVELFLRVTGPQWLKVRIQEVGVQNQTGTDVTNFGTDRDWPVVRKNGKFVKFVPGSRLHMEHYEYSVDALIDQWGGRQMGGVFQKEGGNSIPVLGDSFTFGVGVKDNETFVNALNDQLPYSLINLGVPGSSIPKQLDIIEYRHDELSNPSVYIFVFFVGNDFNLGDKNYKEDAVNESSELRPLKRQWTTQVLQSVNDFVRNNQFLRKIYVIQYVKSKLLIYYNQYRASKGITKRMDDDIFHVITENTYFDSMVGLLNEELQKTTELAREKNFRPIFIIIPDRHQVEHERLKAKLEYYGISFDDVDINLPNRILKENLESFNISSIDISDCLKKKFEENKNDPLYYVLDNHLTHRGHQKVAECSINELSKTIQMTTIN